MKKVILSVAVVTALFSCNSASSSKDGGDAKTSIVGKWHVVTMTMDEKNDTASQRMMKEGLAKENMNFEFMADGSSKVSGNTMPASSAKYTVDGKNLYTTDSSGKKDTAMITKLTDKALEIRNDKEKMNVIMEKM